MSIKQTRIFVPPPTPYNDQNWVETLVGSVIKPLVTENHCIMDWFWFSRYCDYNKDKNKNTDTGDCKICKIPNNFGINEDFQSIGENGWFRSLRFRYSVADQYCDDFETQARELINAQYCVISDFRPYNHINDLGGDRFVGEDRSDERCLERARLMEQYLCYVCKLFIHCLVGPDDGRYRLERSDHELNPNHSVFESIHHLFCNITNVSLRVQLPPIRIPEDWRGSEIILPPINMRF
jgi:hypothetical protein